MISSRGWSMSAVLAALLCLSLAAPAFASREPTKTEAAAIKRAVRKAEGASDIKLSIGEIRVAKDGEWAVASVTIDTGHATQEMLSTLYKSGRRWVDASSPDAENRVMPGDVERDLGLADSSWGGTPFRIYLFVTWFFGLAGLVDVLLQPRRAFREAGHSKGLWFVIELVGLPLFGLFTWGFYAWRIRPGVVAAGGRSPRKRLNAILDAMSEWGSQPRPERAAVPQSGGSAPSESLSFSAMPREPQTCGLCGGDGRIRCNVCSGQGRVRDDHGVYHDCTNCGGPNARCPNCHGTGKV